ncbi:MAG: hypothetical protein KC609_15755 [Myxococcales bacterium]|nr:hypothetical protein [Myxococcales bacterium]
MRVSATTITARLLDRLGPLAVLVSLVALVACGSSKSATAKNPIEVCRADSTSACCSNSDCETNQVCDFSYICSPTPDGVSCSSGSGSRVCLDRCDGGTCPGGTTCTQIEQFSGGDAGMSYSVCQ